MGTIAALPTAPVLCPVCGRKPYIEQCGPWPKNLGPAPFAVGCYSTQPVEHFVGVNGDTRPDAIRAWNAEADKIKRKDFDSPATTFPK